MMCRTTPMSIRCSERWADFDHLVKVAHEHGIRVIIAPGDVALLRPASLVRREAGPAGDNPKSEWYVWAEPKPDGTPPNNWPVDLRGGSAWQWDGKREQYYMHNFLTSQPDLNLHNEEVQAALLDVVRFWLDRGVDGFRLDTINFFFHDRELRDNPPLAKDLRNDTIAPAVNPYNHQLHVYEQEPAGKPRFPASFPRPARRVSRHHRRWRGRRGAGRASDRRRLHLGRRQDAHVLRLRSSSPTRKLTVARVRKVMTDFITRGARGMGLLGVLQP